MKDHLPALILGGPLLVIPLAVLAALLSSALTRGLAYVGLLSGLVSTLACFPRVLQEGVWRYSLGGWAPPWGIELVLTPFSCLFLALIWILSAMTLSRSSYKSSDENGTMPKGLVDTFLLSLAVILSATVLNRDLLTLYLLMELGVLTAGGLIAFSGERNFSDGFRFVLWGSVSAEIFLLGAGYLYAATGTLHGGDLLAQLFITKNFQLILASGFLVTAGWALPFLFPAPCLLGDLTAQAPPSLLALLSAAFTRVSAVVLFFLLFFALGVPGLAQPEWLTALEHLLTALLLCGFLLALRQDSLRAFLGYWSVAQGGYLLMGLHLGNKAALTGMLFELLNQFLVMAGLFFIAENLEKSEGVQRKEDFAGLSHKKPVTSLMLVLLAASVAGIPPTGGSLGKWYLLQGALEKKDWFYTACLGTAFLLNLTYFLWLVWKVYGKKMELPPEAANGKWNWGPKWPVVLLTAGVLALGLFNKTVIHDFMDPSLPKAFQNLPAPNVPFLGKEVE
jgi:multicomponent Na+:H+ antiporter subunit D